MYYNIMFLKLYSPRRGRYNGRYQLVGLLITVRVPLTLGKVYTFYTRLVYARLLYEY